MVRRSPPVVELRRTAELWPHTALRDVWGPHHQPTWDGLVLRNASWKRGLPAMITAEQLAALNAMNTEVNSIPYQALPKIGDGVDRWKDQPDGGDWVCRDYCLNKAERAQDLGWPQSSLYVVLCNTEMVNGQREYHAVQAIDDGEAYPLILDSRQPYIYRLNRCPGDYEWLDRQVPLTWPIQWEPITA